LKKANVSIQTLTTRLAKYELAMAAEREIGRTNSVRMIGGNLGSDFSGAKVGIPLGPRGHGMVKSSGSALSPATGYG
jgi:hypothetical protein